MVEGTPGAVEVDDGAPGAAEVEGGAPGAEAEVVVGRRL